MKSKRRWFFGLALTFPLVILLLVLSSMQLASADTGQADVPHWFYGHLVDEGGGDLPAGTVVEARDDAGGVIWTGIDGNPITTEDPGVYGAKDPDNPSITDFNLAVQGAAKDMYEGLPISFYVNGVRARGVRPCGSDEWLMDAEAVWPWKSDRKTCLDIMGGPPPEQSLLTIESPGCYSVTVTYGDVFVVPAGGTDVFTITTGDAVDLEVFPGDECCTWVDWSDGVTETHRTFTVTGMTTLIANSTLVEYNLTINQVGDGTVEPYVGTELQPCGETVAVTATEAVDWTFAGWTGDLVSMMNTGTVLMDGDKEITATFSFGVPYPLTVTATACYSIQVTPGGIVAAGATEVFTVTGGSPVELATIGECCDLNAWMINGADHGNADPYTFVMPEGPTTVEDDSNGPPFTLTVNVGGEGGGTVEPFVGEQAGYLCGDTETLTATALFSSTFAGWIGDVTTDTNPLDLIIDEDLLVTATFELRTFDLTDIVYPTDTVTPDPEPPWTYGDEVTFTADAISGCYEFTGWSGDLEGYDTLSVTVAITGPMEFAPVYDQLRQVTLTVYTHTFGNPVTVTVEPPGGIYTCGEVVTLTAAPTQTFRYWEEDGWQEPANPAMVPMTDDREITAVFGFDPDTLVIVIDPPGGSIGTGETLTFTVTVTDDMGNEGDVTADATFTTTDPGGTFEDGVYTPGGDGTWQVCVTYQGEQECVTVNVGAVGPTPIFVGQIAVPAFQTLNNVSVTVRFDGATNEVMSAVDASGVFTVYDDELALAGGDYTVCVKELRTLAECYATPVTIPSIDPPVVFDDLYVGDTNGDNAINMIDFSVWAGIFNGGAPTYDKRGDFNNDAVINMIDFSVWAGAFNGGAPPPGDAW